MAKSKQQKREVIYDKVVTKLRTGTRAMTVEDAIALLGWCEDEKEAVERGFTEHHYEMENGTKVWFFNNFANRPIYSSNVAALKQKHLNREMVFNAEPIKIGRTGIVVDGQHFSISLIEAEKERLANLEKWAKHWQGPITAEKLIVYGIEESDTVMNSMDCVRPRSSTDVIFRSDFYADKSRAVRLKLSSITDTAVRLLWERTGAKLDAWSPYRTHGETIDFIRRHMRICDAVRHIANVDKDGELSPIIGAGIASGIMYLQAASDADSAAYYGEPLKPVHLREEKGLGFANWDKACEFWDALPKSDSFKTVREAITSLFEGGTVTEKKAILLRAWSKFVEGKAFRNVALGDDDYTKPSATGHRKLAAPPRLTGIDLGDSDQQIQEKAPVDKAEIEQRMEEAKTGNQPTPETDVKVPAVNEPAIITALTRLHKENPDVVVIFVKSAIGRWIVWDEGAKLVGMLIGKEPKLHPTTLLHLSFKQDEIEAVTDQLTTAGHVVGMAEKVNDVEQITSILRPAKAKKGRNK